MLQTSLDGFLSFESFFHQLEVLNLIHIDQKTSNPDHICWIPQTTLNCTLLSYLQHIHVHSPNELVLESTLSKEMSLLRGKVESKLQKLKNHQGNVFHPSSESSLTLRTSIRSIPKLSASETLKSTQTLSTKNFSKPRKRFISPIRQKRPFPESSKNSSSQDYSCSTLSTPPKQRKKLSNFRSPQRKSDSSPIIPQTNQHSPMTLPKKQQSSSSKESFNHQTLITKTIQWIKVSQEVLYRISEALKANQSRMPFGGGFGDQQQEDQTSLESLVKKFRINPKFVAFNVETLEFDDPSNNSI